jgi:hypothetical protein
MATKTKNAKKVQGPKQASLDAIQKEQLRERRMMSNLNNKAQLTRWLLIAVIVLILLLLLFFGYATDWLRGLHKDSTVTPVSSSLDASKDASTSADPSSKESVSDTSSNGTTGKSTSTNSTSHDSTFSTTTNSTTTNNSTTPPSSGILNLYGDSNAGDNIDTVLSQADQLGLTKTCHTEILVQVCDITDGVNTITTKNLIGSGTVTSITKNF